jgi:8-oxo-dGTP pyrophosphatase MutT (NUDIX family)
MVFNRKKLEDIVKNSSHPEKPCIHGLKDAAVALLIGRQSRDNILGILKAESIKYVWGNQPALPGGIVDSTDLSSFDAVKREVKEELAINNFDIIGSLGHFMTLKNVCVEVFAGFYDEDETIVPLEKEIARVLYIPVNDLMETHIQKGLQGRNPGLGELMYPAEDTVIWGVTAKIIHHFLELAISDISLEKTNEV